MSLTLVCKEGRTPHPEGIHPAVCVDVIELGLSEVEFQGQRKMVEKVKLIFETEQRDVEGRPYFISRNFTASLHPKARLAEFLGKWRGRPVVPGDKIELPKLVGACCTLVVSHQHNMAGHTYASIDAVSKPTRKLTPSGKYDPLGTRQRIEEWRAKDALQRYGVKTIQGDGREESDESAVGTIASQSAAEAPHSKTETVPSPAPSPAERGFDPEVGF